MKYCSHCGNELLDDAVMCMNCGCRSRVIRSALATASNITQSNLTSNAFYPKDKSRLAIWSEITGITSFFIGWFALGITAVILAYLSKKETGGKLCSSAKVGFVCGIVSTALSFFVILCIMSFLSSISSLLGGFTGFLGSLSLLLEEFTSFFDTLSYLL